jgi:flagellar basal-body rod protein FlgB
VESVINNNMFSNTNLLGKSLNATLLRHNVISMNIANSDTPNYKRKDVHFEGMLQEALSANNKLSEVDLEEITPKVVTDKSNYSYRLDGNNVNIDNEMTELAKNQIKYNVLIDQISKGFRRTKIVLSK